MNLLIIDVFNLMFRGVFDLLMANIRSIYGFSDHELYATDHTLHRRIADVKPNYYRRRTQHFKTMGNNTCFTFNGNFYL